jgi:hypothetical protein
VFVSCKLRRGDFLLCVETLDHGGFSCDDGMCCNSLIHFFSRLMPSRSARRIPGAKTQKVTETSQESRQAKVLQRTRKEVLTRIGHGPNRTMGGPGMSDSSARNP